MTKDEVAQSLNWLSQASLVLDHCTIVAKAADETFVGFSANAGPSLLGGQISQLTLNWLMTLLSACTTPDESDSILDGSDPFGAIIDTIDSRLWVIRASTCADSLQRTDRGSHSDTIPETEMEYIRKAMLRILGAVANIHAKPDNMSLPFVGSTSSSTQDLEMDDDVQFVETENQT